MDPATAAIVGAVVGGLASLLATLMAQVLQSQRERRQWLVEKRQEAYGNAIRHLLRVLYKRSFFTAEGVAVLGKEQVSEFFESLTEAQAWLTTVSMYCSKSQRAKVRDLASGLLGSLEAIAGYDSQAGQKQRIGIAAIGGLKETYETLVECARHDLGTESY